MYCMYIYICTYVCDYTCMYVRMYQLYLTECGILNMNTECSMIDFECWRWSTLLNFTSHEWQSTRTGCLQSRSDHLQTLSVHCSWPSRSDGYSDRPLTFQRLIQDATCTTAASQAESGNIALYSSLSSEIDYESFVDGGAHFKFWRLQTSGFFDTVGSLC